MSQAAPDSALARTDDRDTDRPLVTVAILAFNQRDFIQDCIASAFAQTYEPTEVLITDDCSSDDTVAKIEESLAIYGGRGSVTLRQNETNLGWEKWGRLINEVVASARGQLVVLMAGDDISRPDRVKKLVTAWIEAGRPTCVLHSAFETMSNAQDLDGAIRREGRDFGDRTPHEMVRRDGEGMLGATVAFTPDLFTKFGPLPEAAAFEDRTLGFRAILAGQVIYLPDPLVRYRLHSANLSGPNIYSDPARWSRFCRGHQTLYASFRADYLTIYPDGGADARVLPEIERRQAQLRSREKLLTGTFLQKALAAWSVTNGQRNWLYRTLFVLRAVGFRKPQGAKQ
ncbi:glycosyltransferase [Kordiimonas sp.]|uniref:glycosyltransferase n=1 Tax=Kordiimonas sp. TaxID=1970157 RepID=UPI003A9447DA